MGLRHIARRCCSFAPLLVVLVCRSRLWSSMEPAGVAALAVVLDHVHAETLNQLVLELDRLVHDNQQLCLQVDMYRRAEQWLQAVATSALRDLRANDIESAEGRLSQAVEGSDWE